MAIIGIGLVLLSSFFGEIAVSLGKYEVQHQKESIYTMGFLNFFWGALILLFIGLVIQDDFVFQAASLPTFITRAFFETIILIVGLRAVRDADRSTYGFLKTITVPLLLGIDVLIGYAITGKQLGGIAIIAAALLILFFNHGIRKKGSKKVIATAVLAAITISLYKYNITNYNTVEAEQTLMLLYLMIFLFIMARFVRKENPILFFKKPVFLLQSFSAGTALVAVSFAYAFAAASIINTAGRSLQVLFSILSGELYFHEKHVLIKLGSFVLIAIGIWMLL